MPQKLGNADGRYIYTEIIPHQLGLSHYGFFNKIVFNNEDIRVYHKVVEKERDRIDILANTYYGNAKYWWLIAMANDMIDPFVLVPGDILKIPNLTAFYVGGNVNEYI